MLPASFLVLREAKGTLLSKARWQYFLGIPLYTNALYLMANSAVSAGLGFVFWLVVARLCRPEDVGLASALISAKGLLSFLGSLGLGYGLIRFLPTSGARSTKLINSTLSLCGLVTVAGSVIFLLGLPLWSPALAFVTRSLLFVVVFIAFAVASAFSRLLGEVFVAFRRAGFTLAQSIVFSLVKAFLALFLAANLRVLGIFLSWGLGLVLAIGASLFLFLPRLHAGYRPWPSWERAMSNEMTRFSLANYAAEGLWTAPAWLLPLMVVNFVGGEANGHFYISWGMAGLILAIPATISTSLFAEGSHQASLLASNARRSLKLTGVLLAPAMLVMLALGNRLLYVFGPTYSQEGAGVLWVVTLSAVPVAVNTVYLGMARVRKNLRDVVFLSAAIALGTLALSYVLIPHLGILGSGLAWLVSHSLVALSVLPGMVLVLRSGPEAAHAAPEER